MSLKAKSAFVIGSLNFKKFELFLKKFEKSFETLSLKRKVSK